MIRRHNPDLPGGAGPAAQHGGSGGMHAYGGVYQQNPGVPPANWQYTGYQPQQQSVPMWTRWVMLTVLGLVNFLYIFENTASSVYFCLIKPHSRRAPQSLKR
jgi:hypothetical protein